MKRWAVRNYGAGKNEVFNVVDGKGDSVHITFREASERAAYLNREEKAKQKSEVRGQKSEVSP